MSDEAIDERNATKCPICGSRAELGCIYGPDLISGGLRWRAGDPSFWGNLVTGFGGGLSVGEVGALCGPYVRGVRCPSCRRIVIEYSGGADANGLELINQASDLERDGEWDRAAALYHKVLQVPLFASYHDYARKGLDAIDEKRLSARDDA